MIGIGYARAAWNVDQTWVGQPDLHPLWVETIKRSLRGTG
jgi:hypothetical protein